MSKEILFKTIKGEKTERVPWVPFVGIHAGKLLGYTAREVLTDGDKLFDSLKEAKKLYVPDGMPVIFDLQVEAEVLGCELYWSEDTPPTVKTHPFAGDNKGIPCACKIPKDPTGRIPLILDVMRRMKKEVGDEVALYGLICGPFTLASHLRGSEIFMDMIMDEDYLKELMEFSTEVCMAMTDHYIDAGMDIIALVDPLVSQVSPSHFESLLAPYFKSVFDYIKSKNAISSFFVCGNATHQIEPMCRTNPDSISVDENVDIIKAKNITDKYGITIGGNIPLTTTMLFGTQMDNMKYVVDLLDNISHDHLIISPGCDMPYALPIENVIGAANGVIQTDSSREMVKNYTSEATDVDVVLPDYNNLNKVLIELFTLDSDSCAACTYMLKSVVDIYDEIKDIADYVEHKYTTREGVARVKKMGNITNLPTMCINGEVVYISIIPDRNELIAKVKEYAQKLI